MGRTLYGAGRGAGVYRPGCQPGEPRAGSGELRMGRLWRGVWPGGAVLGDVVTNDP